MKQNQSLFSRRLQKSKIKDIEKQLNSVRTSADKVDIKKSHKLQEEL